MQNLKIKVNNEAESKEVQELLFELGYGWHGKGKVVSYLDKISSGDFGWLVLWKPTYLTSTVIQMGSGFEDCKEVTLPELRDMVHQEQGELFLTPECTLNDQYAEIEQVRQQSIEATLAERGSRYGDFESVAETTRALMLILTDGDTFNKLSASQYEALHMICSKMARIVNGDPDYKDNWHDIGGYAKLIENNI